MKKVIGYIRVSTDGQATDDKYGIDEQREIIENYCKVRDMEVIDWYIDQESGSTEIRPEFDEILFGDVTNPPVEAVVVYKSDRIARSIKLYFYYMFLLEKRGISLISATEEVVNDDTGLGDVYKSMMLFVAEQERRNITRRTKGGRRQKAKLGGYAGGKAPFGYKVNHGRLIVDKNEKEIVLAIFSLRESGLSMREIAAHLNKMGYTNRSGRDFQISSIQSILNNEMTYKGYYRYGDVEEWVVGQQEAIL